MLNGALAGGICSALVINVKNCIYSVGIVKKFLLAQRSGLVSR